MKGFSGDKLSVISAFSVIVIYGAFFMSFPKIPFMTFWQIPFLSVLVIPSVISYANSGIVKTIVVAIKVHLKGSSGYTGEPTMESKKRDKFKD